MSIIDSLLQTIAPHTCIGCQTEGSLLCADCTTGLPDSPPECYFCHQPRPDCQTCASCFSRAGLHQVVVCTLYAGIAKDLVWRLKFGGAQAAAGALVLAIPALNSPNLLIIPVPTATGRVRRRGYDQAALLAQYLARRERLAYVPCLRRQGQSHQVGANRKARLVQLRDAFSVVRPERVRGNSILIVDDVITTGSTFEAAARALYAAGAAQVSALAFARSE
ncbi:MAG: phosphoribosyltransferase family protein [Candidatus Saccharimonadales bacterium]